jgi:UDP-GlcNAc:undecaprenyl-phosphate/decaprenyl-phosphate GlcNAc-1-phosphate transferase
MDLTPFAIFLASLIIGILSIYIIKPKIKSLGIVGKDVNKKGCPKVPESCGMILLIPIWSCILILLIMNIVNPLAYIFLFTITCFASVGFFDDCFRFFKKEHDWRKYAVKRGLVLVLISIPFAFIVSASFGVLAVIISVLLIILTASLSNSFAGLNGWEIGSSFIITCALVVMLTFSLTYTTSLVLFALILLGAVSALLLFNTYPASAFPGDSGTLLIGSFIGCLILFVNPSYLALPLFIPHLVDISIKLRTNHTDMSQKSEKPYLLQEGKLHIPSSGRLDFAKLVIRCLGPMGEKEIVRRIWLMVGINSVFWTLLFILLKT